VPSVAFAAISALVWGAADYCGGRATQRASALTVAIVSQLFSLPVLVICLLLLPGTVHGTDLAWGAGAGAAGLFGIVLLYRSLSLGAMAVVAPITAVTGALVPLVVGLLVERTPSVVALTGAGCAIVAIALVSLGPREADHPVTTAVIGLALGSGLCFGVFFVLLSQTHANAGMWPLLSVRVSSLALGFLLAWRRRVRVSIPTGAGGWMAFAGIGDIAANAFYLLATHDGLLSIVAPIAALYPVSTVTLALVVDKERVRPVQVAGLGLAATALILTAV
jgi:drug/metabolite transporter (DMT)-like permease